MEVCRADAQAPEAVLQSQGRMVPSRLTGEDWDPMGRKAVQTSASAHEEPIVVLWHQGVR